MSQTSPPSETRPRVLIVDDEEELLELLTIKFNKIGFEVSAAATGLDAAEMILSNEFQAILCDLNLPADPKGIDLYNLASKKKGLTFIAITGYAQDSPEVEQARCCGIKHIFTKPLPMRTIAELISHGSTSSHQQK